MEVFMSYLEYETWLVKDGHEEGHEGISPGYWRNWVDGLGSPLVALAHGPQTPRPVSRW